MTSARRGKKVVRMPKTLREAHELLGPNRPADSALLEVRLSFFRESARIYAEVAETDRGHHHEALYWATREREHAEEVERQIARRRSQKPE